MKKFLLVLFFTIASSVYAVCPNLYAPTSEKVVKSSGTELCNSFYVSVYDEGNNAVRYVSERLEGNKVGVVSRINAFRADSRLAKPVKPSDYTFSGYDKGHMAPADDASDASQMRETFLMTNMTPQEPTLNQQSWKRLEDYVRTVHLKNPSTVTYVETIPTYVTKTYNGKIPVPDGYWKIVTKDGKTLAYYADNLPKATVKAVTPVSVKKLIAAQKL